MQAVILKPPRLKKEACAYTHTHTRVRAHTVLCLYAFLQNYYEMLNLPPESGRSEIRENYRKMQKICHPDLAGEDAAEFCILLNEAYATLSEEGTREKYDRQLQIYKEIVAASGFEYTGK